MTCSAQLRGPVWPIFWKYKMFKRLFRGFWGVIFWYLEKYLSKNMLHYQKKAQKSSGFWILCSFDTFCSILRARAHWAIFWNIICLRTFIGGFRGDLWISKEIIMFFCHENQIRAMPIYLFNITEAFCKIWPKNGTVRPTDLQNTNFSLKIQPESYLRPLEGWKIISNLTDFKICNITLFKNLKIAKYQKFHIKNIFLKA